jgi:hypothetical protein
MGYTGAVFPLPCLLHGSCVVHAVAACKHRPLVQSVLPFDPRAPPCPPPSPNLLYPRDHLLAPRASLQALPTFPRISAIPPLPPRCSAPSLPFLAQTPYTSTPSLQLLRPIATHRMHHCPSAPTFGGVLTSSWPARSLAVGPASPRPAGPYRASSASSTLCTSGLPHQALPTPRRLPAAEAYNTTALDTYTGAFSRPRFGPEVTRPLNKHSADHLLGPPHLRAQVVGRHVCCLPTCM